MLTIQTRETPVEYDIEAVIAVGDEHHPLAVRGTLVLPIYLWHRVLDRWEHSESRGYLRLHRICGPCAPHEVHEAEPCDAAMSRPGWDGPCGCRATADETPAAAGQYESPAQIEARDAAASGERAS